MKRKGCVAVRVTSGPQAKRSGARGRQRTCTNPFVAFRPSGPPVHHVHPRKRPSHAYNPPVRLRIAIVAVLLACACRVAADPSSPPVPTSAPLSDLARRIVDAANERTTHTVRYDGAYVRIPYPGGDVPADQGVCTDVLVRAFRSVGFDLQKLVHEDMRRAFSKYPRTWGAAAPDPNIDHRRVPNLMTFFARNGAVLPKSTDAADYTPADIVAWRLPNGLTHIGILVERGAHGRPLAVHNIGAGPQKEDVLFEWEIIGHYRWPKEG
ncbi:DUF1287 domain-containing protein [bacterium]|nr:DUF1287 domain-containing protein [bacterium]